LSFGLLCAFKPLADDLKSSARAEQVISSISNRVDRTNDKRRLESLAQAQAYNLSLGGEGASLDNATMGGGNEGQDDILEVTDRIEDESISPYEEQLNDEQMKLANEIDLFLADFAVRNDYDAVLRKEAAMFINPKWDVTDEVAEGLNARYNAAHAPVGIAIPEADGQ
jgi:hypothetical protein